MRQPPAPKSILITHVYSSDNNGDAALTSVLINDLKRKFPRATLKILKLDRGEPGDTFEGVVEYPAFMSYVANKYHHPGQKLCYALGMMLITLLWAKRRGHGWLPHELRMVAELYQQADLVVAVGGGYIRSRRGLVNRFNIPLLLHPLLFGYFLGKPTVLYSQSVGPFMHRSERWMVAFVLKKMAAILIREDTSMKLLASVGVRDNVVRAIDSGFLLHSKAKRDLRAEYDIPRGKRILGVTVRSWLKGEAQHTYEQAVARALEGMIKKHQVHVLFIPQVTASKGDDDRVASRRVFNLMRQRASATVIEQRLNHHEIKSVYDGLDMLLGTRFHSVIFSLTSYVPVVAIEYEHKTSGIMRDLNLEQWVIAIETVTAKRLTTLLQQLIDEYEDYKTQLHESVPPYLKRAEEAVELAAAGYFRASP